MPPLNVRDLLVARLGVPVSTRFTQVNFVVSTTGTQIARGAPHRIGLAIVNSGPFVMFVRPLIAPPAGIGFRVEPNGGALILGWEEDGEVVAWPWFGTSVGGDTDLFTMEQMIEAAPLAAAGEGG